MTLVRLDPQLVKQQMLRCAADTDLLALVEAVPGPAVILNEGRQILVANRRFLAASGVDAHEAVQGKRPGEAIGCVEASRGPDGCGTALACAFCGAHRSLGRIEAGTHGPLQDSCRILRRRPGSPFEEAIDLDATVTRLPQHQVVLLTLQDTSDENRRRVLERTFFHDVLNTAGGVSALSGLAVEGDTDALRLLPACCEVLVEEIRHQQTLIEAEDGDLEVVPERVPVSRVLEQVRDLYRNHPVCLGRQLEVDGSMACVHVDPVLLRRCLGNLVKNALEASREGVTVTLAASTSADHVRLSVTNPGELTPETRSMIFKRSFSTKGRGRGIGSYSVKLLTERYLGGTVGYASGDGVTRFWIELPLAR